MPLAPERFCQSHRVASVARQRCVFVGVSMTDVNLIRWLGMRAVAIHRDRETQRQGRANVCQAVQRTLRRRFWMRNARADPRASRRRCS
jgi:FMN phosphatase YigB (HAD superfamily)